MKVVALIADIIQSKEILEREQFQKNIESILKSVSKRSQYILSPYTLTLGDEFQAVYKNGNEILTDILHIVSEIHPVKIRFALGVNKITTELNEKLAIGMDGPAFHIARDGILELKKYEYSILKIFDGESKKYDFINNGLILNFSIMDGWKENTMSIFKKLYDGKKVKDMINDMKISQRAIYKIINTNNLTNYVDYFKSLEKEIIGMIKE